MKEIMVVYLRWHPIPHWEVAEYVDDEMVRMEWEYSEEDARARAQEWE